LRYMLQLVVASLERSSSATSYELQISEDPNLIFGVQTYKITGLTYYIYSNLVYSTKYYWRVRALNDELESPWSDVLGSEQFPKII
jgi:hypothetical protein